MQQLLLSFSIKRLIALGLVLRVCNGIDNEITYRRQLTCKRTYNLAGRTNQVFTKIFFGLKGICTIETYITQPLVQCLLPTTGYISFGCHRKTGVILVVAKRNNVAITQWLVTKAIAGEGDYYQLASVLLLQLLQLLQLTYTVTAGSNIYKQNLFA